MDIYTETYSTHWSGVRNNFILHTRGENAAYLIKLSISSFVYWERVIIYPLRQEQDIDRGLPDSKHTP